MVLGQLVQHKNAALLVLFVMNNIALADIVEQKRKFISHSVPFECNYITY